MGYHGFNLTHIPAYIHAYVYVYMYINILIPSYRVNILIYERHALHVFHSMHMHVYTYATWVCKVTPDHAFL